MELIPLVTPTLDVATMTGRSLPAPCTVAVVLLVSQVTSKLAALAFASTKSMSKTTLRCADELIHPVHLVAAAPVQRAPAILAPPVPVKLVSCLLVIVVLCAKAIHGNKNAKRKALINENLLGVPSPVQSPYCGVGAIVHDPNLTLV